MLKNILAVATILVPTFASAEIILTQTSIELLDGVTQTTVSAVGTEGEQINTFAFLELTGNLHQVGTVGLGGDGPTPTLASHDNPGFASNNAAFDTYFLLNDFAVQIGEITEDLQMRETSGTLPLETAQLFGMDVPTGFGTRLGNRAVNGSATVVPGLAGDNVPFLQVVHLTDETALLDVRVDAPGASATFEGYVVGAIPEPSTALLAGLALVGFVARRK